MATETAADEIRREMEAYRAVAREEAIELGRVRDYLLSLELPGDFDPGQPVPSLFLLTLGRTRRPQPAKGGAVNVGNELELLAPVFVGDVVSIRSSVGDIQEKRGKVGSMFLVTTDWTYTNQRGETVARGKTHTMRWGQ